MPLCQAFLIVFCSKHVITGCVEFFKLKNSNSHSYETFINIYVTESPLIIGHPAQFLIFTNKPRKLKSIVHVFATHEIRMQIMRHPFN